MRNSAKALWLDRGLIIGPYLALATNEAEYSKALKHLKVKEETEWITNSHSDATCHWVESPDSGLCCIVAVRPKEETTGIQIAAILVHEAVHVWQQFCINIGEKTPSAEFEAYSIQAIAQRLMEAYAATKAGDLT